MVDSSDKFAGVFSDIRYFGFGWLLQRALGEIPTFTDAPPVDWVHMVGFIREPGRVVIFG